MSKVGRLGIRIADLYEPETCLSERLLSIAKLHAPTLQTLEAYQAGSPEIWAQTWLAYCQEYREKLKPYVAETTPLLHTAVRQGKNILFEGAQGTLLDVDYGTYPYVTSSNATAGGACTGSGIGPTRIDKVIGVMKAYTTRVGEGPFPTELTDEVGQHLVEVGQEYGTTTGRLRRCGWFDAVIGKYSVQVNGLDEIALTKLDVLSGLAEIKICTAYRNRETGELLTDFPSQLSVLQQAEPVYETHPGWEVPLSHLNSLSELPQTAQAYLNRLCELLDTPLSIISVGAERNQTLYAPQIKAAVSSLF